MDRKMIDLSSDKAKCKGIPLSNPEDLQADKPERPPASDKPERPAKSDKQELKHEVVDFIKLVVWFLVIFLGLRSYVIEGYEVQGPSMIPTLENNERILVLKLPHILGKFSVFSSINAIDPGDIVVFDSPDTSNKRYVKRVIAMGPKDTGKNKVDAGSENANNGDQVYVKFELGNVYVNNVRLEEKYLRQEARTSPDRDDLTLGPGEYYVLGDNRRVSKDSRSFNAIDDESIIGKAFLRFWPPSRIGFLK